MILRIKNLSLKIKFVVAFLIVGIFPLAIGEYLCLNNAEKALKKQSFMQLESIREIKKAQIQKFFQERKGDLNVLTQTIESIKDKASKRLETIQMLKKHQLEATFQTVENTVHALKDNPFSALAIHKFNQAFLKNDRIIGGADWLKIESEFSAVFKDIKQDFNYDDVFLISPGGDIVYTVEKKADLGQNLLTGNLKGSGLALVFQNAKTVEIAVSDFQPYAPSDNMQSLFMAGAVRSQNNLIGIIAIQVPIQKINDIIQHRSGMGKTGESFLVGQLDGNMRLCSNRVIHRGDIGMPISDDFAKKALNGKKGTAWQNDEKGNLKIIIYEPLSLQSLNWAILTTESIEENIAHKKEGQIKDFCQQYIEAYNYRELFLIDSNGFVFYTTHRAADYHSNLVNGKYANSGLGKLIKNVTQTKSFGFADFEPYAPINDEPAAFIAQPILQNDTVDMIVGLQLSLKAINTIMQQREGMGSTGETYLVGEDKRMRSDSFLDPTDHSVEASFRNPSKGTVDTEASRTALSGKKGEKIIKDYNNNWVLSAFSPLTVFGCNWALIAEIDCAEAFAPVYVMQKVIVAIMLLSILGILLVSLLMTKSLMSPIQKIIQFIEKIRLGNKEITLTMDNKDETGTLGTALNEMVMGQRALLYNLDHLPTPVMEIDNDYSIKYMNHAGLNVLGLSIKDVVGKKCYSFFKTSHCQTNDCACHKAMTTQQGCTADTIADPEGINLPIRYTGFPIKDHQGHVTGAIEFVLNVSGERDINKAIVEIIQSINNGDFSQRGDAELFTGNYRELVTNVNNIVEAFVQPLRRIQNYVAMISRGEIPEKITEQAKGDFGKLNTNLNMCIDAVNNLIKDANVLVNAAISGHLDTRADDSKHQGDFAKIVKGINETLDAVLMPIKEAQIILERISEGDLTLTVNGDYQGDHAMIKEAINNTLSSLNQILEQVADVSKNVSASAIQLNSASQHLAESSQQQAASVQEISSSIHETDRQIRQNAENADMANALVAETNQAATTGQKEMNHLSQAMKEINDSAQNISKIIKVIDEIAFQTNILALNAAVEAARAGQHGKGFAVVAQEVRNLAGRSAQAAKETAELIDNSNKKAMEGVQISERTGIALEQVVENVLKVKDLVADIAVASKEQTQAMGQINDGMGQISTAVQNISSQSEETASAATELSGQSDQLKAQLAKFKLLDNHHNIRQTSETEDEDGISFPQNYQVMPLLQ
ncbi:MAG: HAMP domain-containing protein [Candidatus Magnetomorum sp.]|nr:HAMP domain-containing protein [Candidatus Magnetomorum sp.]